MMDHADDGRGRVRHRGVDQGRRTPGCRLICVRQVRMLGGLVLDDPGEEEGGRRSLFLLDEDSSSMKIVVQLKMTNILKQGT